MKLLSLVLMLTVLVSVPLSSQNDDCPISLKEIVHHCTTNNLGSIDLELQNEEDYTFIWHDGVTSLDRIDVPPGTYILNVQNNFGCSCSNEYKIETLDNCTLQHNVSSFDDCWDVHQITLSSGGIPINTQGMTTLWSDGYEGGFERLIHKSSGFNGWVRVGDPQNLDCCYDSININVQPNLNLNCDVFFSCNCPIIVNEHGTYGEDNQSFVELIVIGNGTCDGTVDIRKCIIDDNNGDMIPPISSITEETVLDAGISMGFLQFADHEQWAAISNGSMIIISEEGFANPPIENDPYDDNGDLVYKIEADNIELLSAKTGEWDQSALRMKYDGIQISPSWELIKINQGGDGIQIVDSEKEFCHGLAFGTSSNLAATQFPLWIDGSLSLSWDCSFLNGNQFDISAFSCSNTVIPTPGTENSIENETYLLNLKDCNPKGILCGKVFLDSNENGVLDDGEPGIPNIDVLIADESDVPIIVETDAYGNYCSEVTPGTIFVLVLESDPDFPIGAVQSQGMNPNLVVVMANTYADVGTDGYIIKAPICGELFYDNNENGLREDDEAGIANVDIIITSSNGELLTVETVEDGKWYANVDEGTTIIDIDDTDPDFPTGSLQTVGEDPTSVTGINGELVNGGVDGFYRCIDLDLKVFLEGALYLSNENYSDVMSTELNDLGWLPGQIYIDPFFGNIYNSPGQPYDLDPWYYFGNEGDAFDSYGDVALSDAGYQDDVVDWVLISLREDASVESKMCETAALLLEDGTVNIIDSLACCGLSNSSYFIVIEHRNHLIIMSPDKVEIDGTLIQFDFTNTQTYTDFLGLGDGQKEITTDSGNTIFAMFAANSDQQASSSSDTDLNVNDRVIWQIQNNSLGYKYGDANLSGDVNVTDRPLFTNNNNIFSSVPR